MAVELLADEDRLGVDEVEDGGREIFVGSDLLGQVVGFDGL